MQHKKDKPSIFNAVITPCLLARNQMQSHVYYKLQVKFSFLAIRVCIICQFQAFISSISATENTRPKFCQFYASNRELTPVFNFHLPAVSNTKSTTCMAALSKSVNWVFFPPHFICLFLSKTPPHVFCV